MMEKAMNFLHVNSYDAIRNNFDDRSHWKKIKETMNTVPQAFSIRSHSRVLYVKDRKKDAELNMNTNQCL